MYNIVTKPSIINEIKKSKYYRQSLGLVTTVEHNGQRKYNEKDKFSFFYNTTYKTNIQMQGNLGDILVYLDYYINEEVLALYYNQEEFIFSFDTKIVKEKGIDFYHNVIDYCIENEIEPFVTIYHWDLPLELEKKGGWTNREIISWFEEYVKVCINAFGQKVKNWIVLNEPSVFTGAGYFLGIHAPGKKGMNNFLPAMHHALLCQAIGFKTIKEKFPEACVGTTYSCTYVTPKTYSEKDLKATERVDALINRAFIEPTLGLGYPIKAIPFLKHITKHFLPGDEELLKVNFDFIGLQNYTREVVAHNTYVPYINAKLVPAKKRNVDYTLMNWEIYPKSIYYLILKFSKYAGVKKIIITENGASFFDEFKHNMFDDKERIEYIKSYMHQVLLAKQNGGKVEGYFIWSLTDNFEWAEGYKQRFGLVYIDYETQKRTIKNSGYWYQEFLKDTIPQSV